MKKILLIFLIFITVPQAIFAYKNRNVILVAGKDAQTDSIGYNIVEEMAQWMNVWINEGKVVLWDSPEKKYQIKSADLSAIEASSGTSFTEVKHLFIYETWTSKSKKFSFSVKGISFASENIKGEEILFGFVEYNGALKQLLNTAYMRVNANAPHGLTLQHALMNKEYEYSLIFFDETPIQDVQKSLKIQRNALGSGKKKHLNKIKVSNARLVEYAVEPGNSSQSFRSVFLRDEINKFFNQNPQEFYNYGGDKVLNFIKKAPIIITDLRVQEIWTTDGKGRLTQKPVNVIPYVMGMPLNPIPIEQWDEWNFYAEDKKLADELAAKNFHYTIKKINSTVINSTEAEQFKQVLFGNDWDNLLKYKTEKDNL